jgi:hypothetical protein
MVGKNEMIIPTKRATLARTVALISDKSVFLWHTLTITIDTLLKVHDIAKIVLVSPGLGRIRCSFRYCSLKIDTDEGFIMRILYARRPMIIRADPVGTWIIISI